MLQNQARTDRAAQPRPAEARQEERREEREFYLFISPWIIGFLLFGAGPIVGVDVLSFTDWSLLAPPKWVGLGNFRRMLSDQFVRIALLNTLYYGVGSVILGT